MSYISLWPMINNDNIIRLSYVDNELFSNYICKPVSKTSLWFVHPVYFTDFSII